MNGWDNLEMKLTDIRDALDRADDCKLGLLNKLLDQMAKDTDVALRLVKFLRDNEQAAA